MGIRAAGQMARRKDIEAQLDVSEKQLQSLEEETARLSAQERELSDRYDMALADYKKQREATASSVDLVLRRAPMLRVIDPPRRLEFKVAPKRRLILVLGVLVSAILVSVYVVVRMYTKKVLPGLLKQT